MATGLLVLAAGGEPAAQSMSGLFYLYINSRLLSSKAAARAGRQASFVGRVRFARGRKKVRK